MQKRGDNVKQLRKTKDILIGGATAIKSVDVLQHANSPTALAGDIQGFVGIGIAGAMADLPFRLLEKQNRKRKRR